VLQKMHQIIKMGLHLQKYANYANHRIKTLQNKMNNSLKDFDVKSTKVTKLLKNEVACAGMSIYTRIAYICQIITIT